MPHGELLAEQRQHLSIRCSSAQSLRDYLIFLWDPQGPSSEPTQRRHSVLVIEWQAISGANGTIQNSEEEWSLWPGEVKEGFLKEEAWMVRAYWHNYSG